MGIDIFFGVILAYCCWRAFRQGMARQTIQLCGLALGICFAEPAAAKAAPYASKHISAVPTAIQGPVLVLGAMFAIWLSVSLVGSMILSSYRKRIYGDTMPSLGDSVFGLGVGAVKAAFLVSLAVFAFEQLPDSLRKIQAVEDQVKVSKGVKFAHDYPIVTRIIGTQEVQSIGRRVQELVEYFRKSDGKPGNLAPSNAPSPTAPAGFPEIPDLKGLELPRLELP